ncbi:hypothetical protein CLF_107174 [Clonorchis sinensis]|uniref:Uncharacterized protein n=1 Tax=Clonorchis sinensis TaxID=79923 RepID=G7YQH3_CLOSI|nr:hypothetical protein CLF_107174 [Clonorchis sinensis]
MRRPGAAHSVAWKHQKRKIQLGFSGPTRVTKFTFKGLPVTKFDAKMDQLSESLRKRNCSQGFLCAVWRYSTVSQQRSNISSEEYTLSRFGHKDQQFTVESNTFKNLFEQTLVQTLTYGLEQCSNSAGRRISTQIPPYRLLSGAATAEKPSQRKIGQKFGTLAGPASSPALSGRKSGPSSQS